MVGFPADSRLPNHRARRRFLVFLSLCLFGLAAAALWMGTPQTSHCGVPVGGLFFVGFTGMTICLETGAFSSHGLCLRSSGWMVHPSSGSPTQRYLRRHCGNYGDPFHHVDVCSARRRDGPAPWTRGNPCSVSSYLCGVADTLLLVRFGAPAVALTEWVKCAKLIIPGQEAAAVHQMLGFVSFDLEGEGLLSLRKKGAITIDYVNEPSLLEVGDTVIAVNDRPVSSVANLVEQIDQCWCDPGTGKPKATGTCEMVGLEANAGCVSSGLEVKLTVARLDTNGVRRCVIYRFPLVQMI